MDSKKLIRNIRWLGHSGFFIKAKPSIYIDPYNLAFPDIGDLILITNKSEHHCSPEDIKWLRKGATVILAPEECVNLFPGGDIRAAKPGEQHEIKGARIVVLPAYADEESIQSGVETGVGYIIFYPGGPHIYHCGHTKFIPAQLPETVDVLLVPIGKHADLDLSRAIELINLVNPKVAIPVHWDDGSYKQKDLGQLDDHCQAEVVVLKAKR